MSLVCMSLSPNNDSSSETFVIIVEKVFLHGFRLPVTYGILFAVKIIWRLIYNGLYGLSELFIQPIGLNQSIVVNICCF